MGCRISNLSNYPATIVELDLGGCLCIERAYRKFREARLDESRLYITTGMFKEKGSSTGSYLVVISGDMGVDKLQTGSKHTANFPHYPERFDWLGGGSITGLADDLDISLLPKNHDNCLDLAILEYVTNRLIELSSPKVFALS